MALNRNFVSLYPFVRYKSSTILSHVSSSGKARMVDISNKSSSIRTAVASAKVWLDKDTFGLVRDNASRKGDVLSVAELAGIMGAKRTGDIIPLCHQIRLSSVNVSLRLNDDEVSVDVVCAAKCVGETGVEMEALTGASIAALTVYDMCKASNKGIIISDIHLVEKTGGKSDFKKK